LRVTFLTHYYPPEVGAPQARISTLARLLAERGLEVTVHTGFPNYPDGRVRAPYCNRPFSVEQQAGVRVVRSLVYPAPNSGFARRLANHATFASSALATANRAPPADVVVAESPPLFCAAAGVAYARLKRAALVVNVADRWPASAVELGALRAPAAIRAAEALESLCYRAAAAISVPTKGLADSLERHPDAAGKVQRVGPSVDTALFRPTPLPERNRLRLLYAGTMGMAQGLGTLIEAARRVGQALLEVWIAGDGAEAPRVRAALAPPELEHVRLLGSVPHGDVPALYADCDAAVVLLRDRPLFASAVPTKTLEAMAAGRAVLLSARGEVAELVEGAGAGVAVPPDDPDRLAAAIRELARDREQLRRMGEAGRRCAEERFDWSAGLAAWQRLLEDALAARDQPAN